MIDDLRALGEAARKAFETARDESELEAARVEFIGRKGKLREARQGLGRLPPDQRPVVGKFVNELTRELQALYDRRKAALAEAPKLEEGWLDVTLPGRAPRIGHRHPVLATLDQMVEIFMGLGFTVAEGPEIEDCYHSWEALNYPPHHPAMDEQMSFYISPDVLVRSQTSTVQIRYMETHEPPVRIVIPGRCYRRDTVDATHHHTFHQLEGLLVDAGVTFADLKGTLELFAREMYGPGMTMRFRPDFFPFTEPSAEIALTCIMCGGQGCRVCSQSGWLEVGGSGVVDPNVLTNVGYDPEKYTGWAFGFGIDRLCMLRHGIEDIRLLWNNDMRFLNQF